VRKLQKTTKYRERVENETSDGEEEGPLLQAIENLREVHSMS
jgi:hypothetical protein